jgi:hypothetical protein
MCGAEPTGAQVLGRLMQAVFREPILRAQASKGLPASGLVGTGNVAGLPAWAGSAFMHLRRFIASESRAL